MEKLVCASDDDSLYSGIKVIPRFMKFMKWTKPASGLGPGLHASYEPTVPSSPHTPLRQFISTPCWSAIRQQMVCRNIEAANTTVGLITSMMMLHEIAEKWQQLTKKVFFLCFYLWRKKQGIYINTKQRSWWKHAMMHSYLGGWRLFNYTRTKNILKIAFT